MFGRPGWDVLIVLLIVLLLFGAKRLPDLSRSVGRSLRIFKSETKGLREDGQGDDEADDTADRAPRERATGQITAGQSGAPAAGSPAAASQPVTEAPVPAPEHSETR